MGRIDARVTHTPHRRITLSCGHVQYVESYPELGSVRECGGCRKRAAVVVRDNRALEVYCPDCKQILITVGMLATITASTRATVHNVRESKGHHAYVRETGEVESV